jgi:hypothetical protein
MAAQIEAFAIPGKSIHITLLEQQWQKNVDVICAVFHVDESLGKLIVPEMFVVRCLYAAAVLCVLRNTIKATFGYKASRDPITKAGRYGEMGFKTSGFIEVKMGISSDRVWSQHNLIITNPKCDGVNESGRLGGTAGAVNFYLNSIRTKLNLAEPFVYSTPTTSVEGVHTSKLPLI